MSTTPYRLNVSSDRVDMTGSMAQSRTITVSANFAEPFPYAVQVRTSDGASWLNANRVTGLIGESIAVSLNPNGLARGFYHGTVSVSVSFPANEVSQDIDIPVSLTIP